MSWRNQSPREFDPHGGRNAFRNGDNLQSSSECVASFRAMRSFTESIECDLPPAPELPPQLDIDRLSMKTSDTNETIIEVVKPTTATVDPSLGETQKYKMSVPGPGHSEQEHELHKSLLNDDNDLDSEVESTCSAEHAALRRQYSNSTAQRPRPTTPTQSCALERFAFSAPSDGLFETKEEEKIKVTIPPKERAESRRRKSEMSYPEFYENISSQIPLQSRGHVSGRTTPLNNYDGDILEENPLYKDKAPPPPVVNRRSSIEWENFEEAKALTYASATWWLRKQDERSRSVVERAVERAMVGVLRFTQVRDGIRSPDLRQRSKINDAILYAKQSKISIFQSSEEDEPMFSEEMLEERKRTQAHSADISTPSAFVAGHEQASESDIAVATGNAADAVHNAKLLQGGISGYVWNYETQQWEIDPNYDPSQHQSSHYQCDNYDATVHSQGYYYDQAYDQTYSYDQNDGYTSVTNQHDANCYIPDTLGYTGYDQQTNYGYDQPTGFYPGYDTSGRSYGSGVADHESGTLAGAGTTTGYGHSSTGYVSAPGYSQDYSTSTFQHNGYADLPYYQQHAGYNQTATELSEPPIGLDQPEPDYGTTSLGRINEQTLGGYEYSDYYGGYKSDYSASYISDQPTLAPYAWESTAHNFNSTSSVNNASEQHSPSRPPPPSRPAPPKFPRTVLANENVAATHPPPRPPPALSASPERSKSSSPKLPPPPLKKIESEPEEDAWQRFQKLTEKANLAVKTTEDTLKTLSEKTVADEIKDESYLGQVGGTQGYVSNVAQKEIHRLAEEMIQEKQLKKKMKQKGKKSASPTFEPDEEARMDRAAQELAMKMANMRTDLEDWKPPSDVKQIESSKLESSHSEIPPNKKSSLEEVDQSGGSDELSVHPETQQRVVVAPTNELPSNETQVPAPAWTDFEAAAPELAPSESGFFNKKNGSLDSDTYDPFVVPSQFKAPRDPFAPLDKDLIDEDYDPFAVQPVEDIVAAAKAKAEEIRLGKEAHDDIDFLGGSRHSPTLSTPTQEGGSLAGSPFHRPDAFEDDFKCEGMDVETPSPLYDEDDSVPLAEFSPKFTGDGWELMIRHPIKKKSFMADRYWKPCYVRIRENTLFVYDSKTDSKPIQELLLQASYSLSDTTLQAYDVYGKIHTVKLQYVLYKEKVGIRPGQISRLVDGHITKYGLPLEHTAQCTVLLKFGSLTYTELQSFISTIEDILFKCPAKRETKPVYKQDEVQIHCYDEYSACIDKEGVLSEQKARVRLFCLAFVTGSPILEIGLNDRRRQGKEIVRRKDILPMYTERWIRFEEVEFHSTVDMIAFEKEQVIRLSPPDSCFFEVMRFRIRPPKNREKPLNIKATMKIAGSKVEIRIEAMPAAQLEKNKGGKNTRRQIPCEDISIRFPIPEAWIYIFREERHWGVGSVHSKKLRSGKVKNLKDRLIGAVQSSEPNLIECAIGEAKYEHVYRSLVWRIARIPEKHHVAYKSHVLRCRFELSSFDMMPDAFFPRCEVEFTMPLATVSNTVVRSVSVEQHEDSSRVEKFVRYVAKCQYKVEIDYIQCADFEVDTLNPVVNPDVLMNTVAEMHQPAFQPAEVEQVHEGYRIEFNESEKQKAQGQDSSSDDDTDNGHKMPIIQIDTKNYGY
ncbi:hypothetical protein Angca_002572 [Angiostrongylus cantonensis]|nr:hypothetical protein Angca_002572 [Angiostrongylus cantonensis]